MLRLGLKVKLKTAIHTVTVPTAPRRQWDDAVRIGQALEALRIAILAGPEQVRKAILNEPAPKDVYSGKDRNDMKSQIVSAWKERYLGEETVAIRFDRDQVEQASATGSRTGSTFRTWMSTPTVRGDRAQGRRDQDDLGQPHAARQRQSLQGSPGRAHAASSSPRTSCWPMSDNACGRMTLRFLAEGQFKLRGGMRRDRAGPSARCAQHRGRGIRAMTRTVLLGPIRG